MRLPYACCTHCCDRNTTVVRQQYECGTISTRPREIHCELRIFTNSVRLRRDCSRYALRQSATHCSTYTLSMAIDRDCATNVLNSSKHSRPSRDWTRLSATQCDSARLQHDSHTTLRECSTTGRDLFSSGESRLVAVVSLDGLTGAKTFAALSRLTRLSATQRDSNTTPIRHSANAVRLFSRGESRTLVLMV